MAVAGLGLIVADTFSKDQAISNTAAGNGFWWQTIILNENLNSGSILMLLVLLYFG